MRCTCVGVALVLATLPLQGQAIITGHVVSAETGSALAHAVVGVRGGSRLFTDDSGAFVLAVDANRSTVLEVRRIGYAPVDTAVGASAGITDVRVVLTRAAVTLHPVAVKAAAA